MAYDEELAARIRAALHGVPEVTERRMFGGLAFLIGGHLAVAAGDGLLVRVPPERMGELAARPDVSETVMPGRTMRGWLRVEPAGLTADAHLAEWVALGEGVARSLPPKR